MSVENSNELTTSAKRVLASGLAGALALAAMIARPIAGGLTAAAVFVGNGLRNMAGYVAAGASVLGYLLWRYGVGNIAGILLEVANLLRPPAGIILAALLVTLERTRRLLRFLSASTFFLLDTAWQAIGLTTAATAEMFRVSIAATLAALNLMRHSIGFAIAFLFAEPIRHGLAVMAEAFAASWALAWSGIAATAEVGNLLLQALKVPGAVILEVLALMGAALSTAFAFLLEVGEIFLRAGAELLTMALHAFKHGVAAVLEFGNFLRQVSGVLLGAMTEAAVQLIRIPTYIAAFFAEGLGLAWQLTGHVMGALLEGVNAIRNLAGYLLGGAAGLFVGFFTLLFTGMEDAKKAFNDTFDAVNKSWLFGENYNFGETYRSAANAEIFQYTLGNALKFCSEKWQGYKTGDAFNFISKSFLFGETYTPGSVYDAVSNVVHYEFGAAFSSYERGKTFEWFRWAYKPWQEGEESVFRKVINTVTYERGEVFESVNDRDPFGKYKAGETYKSTRDSMGARGEGIDPSDWNAGFHAVNRSWLFGREPYSPGEPFGDTMAALGPNNPASFGDLGRVIFFSKFFAGKRNGEEEASTYRSPTSTFTWINDSNFLGRSTFKDAATTGYNFIASNWQSPPASWERLLAHRIFGGNKTREENITSLYAIRHARIFGGDVAWHDQTATADTFKYFAGYQYNADASAWVKQGKTDYNTLRNNISRVIAVITGFSEGVVLGLLLAPFIILSAAWAGAKQKGILLGGLGGLFYGLVLALTYPFRNVENNLALLAWEEQPGDGSQSSPTRLDTPVYKRDWNHIWDENEAADLFTVQAVVGEPGLFPEQLLSEAVNLDQNDGGASQEYQGLPSSNPVSKFASDRNHKGREHTDTKHQLVQAAAGNYGSAVQPLLPTPHSTSALGSSALAPKPTGTRSTSGGGYGSTGTSSLVNPARAQASFLSAHPTAAAKKKEQHEAVKDATDILDVLKNQIPKDSKAAEQWYQNLPQEDAHLLEAALALLKTYNSQAGEEKMTAAIKAFRDAQRSMANENVMSAGIR